MAHATLTGLIEQQLNNPDNQGTYPPRKSPSKKQTLHYLVWLARKLEAEGETEFLIEGMQPTWLESTKQKIMYREIVGMNIGIFFGVNFVFCCLSSLSILSMTPTFFESISELSMIFLALPMIGGLSGFLIVRGILIYEKRFGSLVNRNRVKLTYIKSTEKISWSFRKFLQIVKNSSLIGLKIGFCIGSLTIVVGTVITTVLAIIQNQLGTIFESILLYIGFYIGFCFLLIVEFSIMGLFLGLMIGIILGLIRSFVILELSNKNFPNQGIWNSLKHGLAISLGVGLFYSLFFGSLINTLIQRYRTIEIGSEIPRLYYIYREIAPTAISCLFCISIVIFLGLSLGLGSVIRHFSLRLMLYRNGNIPWNYAKFLDHATKHRFIQLVGGRYRFMHDLLRKHFAQMPLN